MMASDDKKPVEAAAEIKAPGPLERLQGMDGRFIEKTFDWRLLDAVMATGCEMTECVGIMELSEATICRKIREKYDMTFAEYRDTKLARKKWKLRAKMWEAAEAGNITAQIWLSKNLLGMSDKISAEVTSEVKTINFSYTVPGNRFVPSKGIKPDVIDITEGQDGSKN